MIRKLFVFLLLVAMLAACATDDSGDGGGGEETPAGVPAATDSASPDPDGDPLLLDSGQTANGIPWELQVVPGEPVCVQLRRTDEANDFMVCDEESEQDFNGDEDLRYGFGGLNSDQVPKFVIGITGPEVAKVAVNLPAEGTSPEAETLTSTEVEDRRFFVVVLPSEPAQEVQAIRGLDSAGRTVAGFRMGPPEEEPSPLPTDA